MLLKTKLVSIAANLVRRLPRRPALCTVASEYLNGYHGDNDMRPGENGEYALADALGPGSRIIFDVGANVGEWSLRMAHMSPLAKVHSFEPSTTTFKILEDRTKSLRDRIVINHCGVGATNTSGVLISYAAASELGSFHKLEGVNMDALGDAITETVQLIALDRYCSEIGITAIDFMKVDVEGHEVDVLQGARGLLGKGAIKYVQFEYHATWIYSRSQIRDVFALLANGPYQIYKLLGGGRFLRLRRYSQAIETYQYANYLLVAGDNPLPGTSIEAEFQV